MIKKLLKIKVCGMRDTENIRQLIALKPDFMGFILFPGSKRFVGEDYHLEVEIPDTINRVGIFVNALFKDIIRWVNRLGLNYVQLHGNEPIDYCRELSGMNIPLIKAFGIDGKFDFDILQTYSPYCKYFLFDTKSLLHGGSGAKFDWNHLDGYIFDKPFFLSGGIGPEDIEAVHLIRDKMPIYALDINSRFEIEPGIKDIKLLSQFFKNIKKQTNK